MSDEAYLAAVAAGGGTHCQRCHAPVPVLRTGLSNPPLRRAERLEEGVDCAACHVTPSGVAGSNAVGGAPCAPRVDRRLGDAALCGACHDSIYKDWLVNGRSANVNGCMDCHMPIVTDAASGRSVRNHRFDGLSSLDALRAVVHVEVHRGTKLEVRVSNRNLAHRFPGERHFRVLLVQARYGSLREGGGLDRVEKTVLRRPAPFEAPPTHADIAPGGTIRASFEPPGPGEVLTLRLLYKRFPWVLDSDALLLWEEEVLP